jgi:hypothetical protein
MRPTCSTETATIFVSTTVTRKMAVGSSINFVLPVVKGSITTSGFLKRTRLIGVNSTSTT